MIFQGAIERERAGILSYAVGAMRRQLELGVERAKSRRAGGRKIEGFQAVSHRIAEMRVRLEASRLLMEQALERKAAGRRAPLEAAMAKLYISEAFLANSTDLVRLFGGEGFVDPAVHGYVGDALGSLLYSGTNDIQRNIIAAQCGLDP
jgi:hypothetical protein